MEDAIDLEGHLAPLLEDNSELKKQNIICQKSNVKKFHWFTWNLLLPFTFWHFLSLLSYVPWKTDAKWLCASIKPTINSTKSRSEDAVRQFCKHWSIADLIGWNSWHLLWNLWSTVELMINSSKESDRFVIPRAQAVQNSLSVRITRQYFACFPTIWRSEDQKIGRRKIRTPQSNSRGGETCAH